MAGVDLEGRGSVLGPSHGGEPAVACQGLEHGLHPQAVQYTVDGVGQHTQAHLRANFWPPPPQQVALIPPALEGPTGRLDHGLALAPQLRLVLKPWLPPLQDVLIFPAGHTPVSLIARASGVQGAPPTGCGCIGAELTTLLLGPNTRRHGFSGGANRDILFWVVRQALLATQAQLGLGCGLRFGDVHGHALGVALLDLGPVVVAPVGHHRERLRPSSRCGPLGHRYQLRLICHRLGHCMFPAQFVLLIDGHWPIVTNHAAVSPRGLATVGIRQGTLLCSALLPWLLVALVPLLALLPRRQLLLPRCRRGPPERGFLGILTVEWLKVRRDLRVALLDQPYARAPAEVPLLPIDGLKLAPVNRDQLSSTPVACFAQQRKLPAALLNGGAIVPAEGGDGLDVRSPLAQQPHQVQMPGHGLSQAPTGPHPMQRAVQRESHQVSRIIARPSCCSRRRPPNASRLQSERLDKGIQTAPGMLFTEVIVDGLRQHVRLVAALSANIAHANASLWMGFGAHVRYPGAAGKEFSHSLTLQQTAAA